MSALVTLGLRLARSGGALRAWSIGAGNAIAVLLLLLAGSLPAAMYPDPVERTDQRIGLVVVALFLLVPAAVLLVMVGRLSSGVRDRRLASLRVIGVPPSRTRLVAAVENGVLALAGAVVGAAAFLTVAQPASQSLVRGATGLGAPLDAGPALVAQAILLVVAVSVATGTASTWERTLPSAARSEARPSTPRPWRLLVLAAGVAALAWLAGTDTATTDDGLMTAAMLGGATVTGVGIALVTPLLASWAARALVRSDGVTSRLAGRAMQFDSASASRVVAGLGVAIFLSTGALGVLSAFEAAPQNANAIREFGPGPQVVRVTSTPNRETWDPADLPSLLAVPGVRGIKPDTLTTGSERCGEQDGCYFSVLVGTCAQLELSSAMTGCDDSRAAVITTIDRDGNASPISLYPTAVPVAGDTIPLLDDDHATRQTITLDGPAIIQDLPTQEREWSWALDAVAFVPEALLGDWYTRTAFPAVIADAGSATTREIEAWADEHGYFAWHPAALEWPGIQAMRTAVWSLCGVAIAVALIVLSLGAIDRAMERRRSVARQIMVGVPPRVLQRSQLLQTLVPVTVAVLLALSAGTVGSRAYTNLAANRSALDGSAWLALLIIAGVGGLLAAVSTVPLARTRLTPELLRRE